MHTFSVTKHQYGLYLARYLFLAMTPFAQTDAEFAVARPWQAVQ